MYLKQYRRPYAILTLSLLALCLALTACSGGGEPLPTAPPPMMASDDPFASDAPEPEAVPAPDTAEPAAEPGEAAPDTAEPAPESGEAVPQSSHWPGVLQADYPAGDDFFADAAFIGNSLMVGFEAYSGITTGDYFATVSASVFSAYDMLGEIYDKAYGKVYILLGINEIGYDPEVFRFEYTALVKTIQEAQPTADIYIMALTPVSASKSASDEFFNMTRIWAYNAVLYEIASANNCYFLDLCSALSDENGFLPDYASADGVHFTPDYYSVWLDHLKNFYVPRPAVAGAEPVPEAEAPIALPAEAPAQLPDEPPDELPDELPA